MRACVYIPGVKVVVVYNPGSGRGRGERVGIELVRAVESAGHTVTAMAVRREPGFGAELGGALRGADVFVGVGGDGTMHHAAEAAVRERVAVYHAPLGNENLFAREFGMDARPRTLVAALEAGRIERVDIGRLWVADRESAAAQGRPFLLMASLGPDSSVIHRLSKSRRRALGHMAYAAPTLAELVRPWFPTMTVSMDGRVVVDRAPGVLVVANSRQYALRIDPAVRARMDDGVLDAVFFPCRGRARALLWAAASRLRRHVGSGRLVYEQGREVTIRLHGGRGPFQLDGEAGEWGVADAGEAPTGEADLRLGVDRRALRVLVPVGRVARPLLEAGRGFLGSGAMFP